jgi:hypothetical protein
MSKPMSYGPTAEVLGPERRRRWSKKAKAAIVAETYAPGAACRCLRWPGVTALPRARSWLGASLPRAGRPGRRASRDRRPASPDRAARRSLLLWHGR